MIIPEIPEKNTKAPPFKNKKGQKNFRYPTKKQSFSLEKDCQVPQNFLALLILKRL